METSLIIIDKILNSTDFKGLSTKMQDDLFKLKKELNVISDKYNSLKEEKSIISSSFQNTIESNFIFDLDYKVLVFNKVAKLYARKFWKKELEKGQCASEYADDIGAFENFKYNFKKAVAGETLESENSYQLKTGKSVWFLSKYAPVFDDNKKVIAVSFSNTDITKHHKLQKALRESQERYKFVIEGSNVGIWDWNIITGEVIRNKRWAEMFGYSLEEINFDMKQWQDFIYPDDVEMAWSSINEHLKGKTEIHSLEYRMIKKDGSITWILDQAKVVRRDENGNPTRMSGTYTDINNQKKIEQELAKNEATARAFLSTKLDAIALFDRDLKLIDLNETMAARFGGKVSELKGKNIFLGINQEISEKRTKNILHVFDTKKELRWEDFRQGKWFDNFVYPIMPDGENVEMVAVTARDITDRKESEIIIKENERKLNTLIDNLQGTVYRCKNDRDWTMEFLSSSVYKLTGYAPLDIVNNKKITRNSIIHQDYREEIWEQVQNALNKKTSYSLSFKIICANGEEKWVWEQGQGVFENEKLIALEGFISDISHIKDIEKKLKEVVATKDKFFNIIAHDLRSPFNSILGFSELLLMRGSKFDDTKRELITKSLFESSQKAYKLVENLLTWARTQAGTIEFNPNDIDIQDLLKESIDAVEISAAQKHIGIYNEVEDKMIVCVDRNLMATVFRNLLSNAIKFTPQNGIIVIESKIQDNFLEISFVDNGVGIEKDRIKSIFEIGQNTSTPGTERETGSGLGLILCKEFVEKHRGYIKVKSQINRGSTFFVFIPLKQK
ncbi:MAG: PAS domain-containing protein [Bacteroidales bacterium]|nr:PAS domain-containing protein [Bacteroidales bacterium]